MVQASPIFRLGRWLDDAEKILLIAHERSDGDTLASALAFAHALRRQGKNVTCVSRDPVQPTFHFLPGIEWFRRDFFQGDFDVIIVFDCGDAKRTGFPDRLRDFAQTTGKLVNIDHHPKNDLHRMANLNVIDQEAAATTQLVYEIFQTLGWPIDHMIATCLLCGLYTDTGGFKHPNTTPDVLAMAGKLLAHGGRLKDIIRHLTSAHSVPMLRLWGVVLDRLHRHPDFDVVTSMVTLADIAHCEAHQGDIMGIVNLMKNASEAKMAILFAEQPDGSVRASLRAGDDHIDVTRLASFFGGGGLKKAGGFTVPGQLTGQGDDWTIVWN